MNEYYESSCTQRHVVSILVKLNDKEWAEAQQFWPDSFLYFACVRHTMEDEAKLERNSNFGDFIRWLFKLAPSDKDIPIEVIFRRKE